MTSVDFSRENLSSLLKDGVTDDLFKLLWARDELNFSPMVNVPDTIVYKYGQPVCWYFTSVNGHVKRKNKQNLISAKIEEAFNKHILGYDVIAYFISMPTADHDHSSGHSSSQQPTETTPTVIEYLDREALKSFLYNHRKDVNGILQRFIEPKSTRNEIIRGIWSPKLCLLERAENIHELHDHRYGLYERCVVYEGPDYYYTSAPLRGPVLSGQIQKHCESIVSHIGEVTFGQKQITRIVLNYKVDSRDKIWLLYSTSIRCVDMLEYNPSNSLFGGTERARSLVNIDSVISLSDKVHLNPKKSYDKIQPRVRLPCLSCGREELEDMRHPVTYKCIIKHYDHVLHLMKRSSASPTKRAAASRSGVRPTDDVVMWPPDAELVDAAGGVGFGCLDQGDDSSHNKHPKLKFVKDLQVPPIITTLHPKLNVETYLRCKEDPLFLNKTVHVCEACYLVFAEFQTLLLRMGQNLTKLLTPDPVINTTIAKKGDNRPSSADWRAISSSVSQASMTRSVSAEDAYRNSVSRTALRHQEEAQARAIGIRTSDSRSQPNFPTSIRNPNDSQEVFSQYDERSTTIHSQPGATHAPFSPTNSNYGGFASNASMQSSVTPFKGGLLDSDSQSAMSTVYDPNDVHAMIADRERRFFKEISLNPQLKDQHPLMHLISAQQKLKLVDQQSGVLMSKTASKSASVFGTKYGKQPGDQYDKYGPYNNELPFTVNGEIIKPSEYRARKSEKARKKKEQRQKSLQSFLAKDNDDDGSSKATSKRTGGNANSITAAIAAATKAAESSTATSAATTATVDPAKTNTVMDNNIKSSKKYREFLSESLKKIQSDVEGAAPFKRTNNINAVVDDQGYTQPSTSAVDNSGDSRKAPPSSSSSQQDSKKSSKRAGKDLPPSSSSSNNNSFAESSTTSNNNISSPEKIVASTSAHQPIPPQHIPLSEKKRNNQSASAAAEVTPTPQELPSSKRSTSLSDEQATGFSAEGSNSYVTDHSSTDAPLLPIVHDNEVNKTSPPVDDSNNAAAQQPQQVVSGQMLEEDSAVMLQGGSQDKLPEENDNGEDGFSVSQSEAPHEDQEGSIGSLDESAGMSLEMNSLELQDAASSSLFLSPDNNRDNVMDRQSFQESVAKDIAAEQSLIREQADALLHPDNETLAAEIQQEEEA